ncbi:MAG: transketolase [Elusimicrobia bacterium RIFOXYD2_FULL_34_15]|nr:MAG: transketolase [Elusimicrobia bacterium RIFOXYD2_FULL_34_15]HAM37834.1 transketolase [Elusimicrobiota bacterium]
MRNAFVSELTDISKDPKIFTLLADNGIIVFDDYIKLYPKQFLNVGIAESNMIGVAAGMAMCGFIPFVYTIIPFLTMRPFEYIRNDICKQNQNVKLIGIGAGFNYSTLGPTHHGTEDISIMRCLPNLTVLSPADPLETRKATMAAYKMKGPVYIRIGTGKNPSVYKNDYEFVIGKGIVLNDGDDVTIISTGFIIQETQLAIDELKKSGISVRLINIHTIKPIDEEIILKACRETKAILTVEEHSVIGGLGSAVAEVILEKCQKPIKFKRLGLNGVFASGYGNILEMRQLNGLSKDDIIREAKILVR